MKFLDVSELAHFRGLELQERGPNPHFRNPSFKKIGISTSKNVQTFFYFQTLKHDQISLEFLRFSKAWKAFDQLINPVLAFSFRGEKWSWRICEMNITSNDILIFFGGRGMASKEGGMVSKRGGKINVTWQGCHHGAFISHGWHTAGTRHYPVEQMSSDDCMGASAITIRQSR